ncbi:phage major tail protein [Tetragenococcus muriaticus PMC-11-5]|uniref:Phage major tail protein n=1 Tax=Tetragenococcus muriaticus PMC-11-5 TaxID=1302649 RepID=A0A091C3Q5_9ENTE|nr:major tail protein [Tetragenococcus muriaticus]KFN92446.1 phage major tail protein [Tetragenococcus muriaticus PMC-11-5]
MDLVGAKRVRIQPAGSSEIFVIEGKESEGGVISAEIEGLSKEPSRVHASNVAYYVSNKGTGETSVTFTLLDIPGKVEDEILGYKTDESGISFVGDDTEAPYCAVTLESEDLSGEKAILAFFKGKFSRDAISAETTTNEAPEPEGSEYTFTPISDDRDGKSEGQVMAKYVGNEEATIQELEDLVFDTTVVGGLGEQ